MKIFAVRDDSGMIAGDMSYLIYYEEQKKFFIEVPENRTEWEVPLLISSFVKRGEYTLDSYWSRLWVTQRIVPPDRQNIGQILKDNGLTEYDEYKLLILAAGRCAQDDYYLAPLDSIGELKDMGSRFEKRVTGVEPLVDMTVIVTFQNSMIRKCPLRTYFERHRSFKPLLMREELFDAVKVETGGYGICWNEDTLIKDTELYEMESSRI